MRFKYIEQLDEEDCGAAVLAMILYYYRSKIPMSKIKELAQTDKEGTSALGLIEAAQKFKLDTQAIQADKQLLLNDREELPLPCIAHVNKSNGILHYLIIKKVTSKYVEIVDPDPTVRKKKMSLESFFNIWTGLIIFIGPSKEYIPLRIKEKHRIPLSKLVYQNRWLFLFILVTAVVNMIISIVGSLYLQEIIDDYIPKKSINIINLVAMSMLVLYIFYGIFGFLNNYLCIRLTQKLSKKILLGYVQHLYKIPFSTFESKRTGELTSRFIDASNIIYIVANTMVSAILNLITIIGVGIVLIRIDIKLFYCVSISIPIYSILIFIFSRVFDNLNNERMESSSKVNTSIIEDLSGMQTIKALDIVDKRYNIFNEKFNIFLKSNKHYDLLISVHNNIRKVIHLLIELSIIYYGTILVIVGDITLGELMAFVSLLAYFTDPLEEIVGLQDEIQTAKVAYKRLNQILSIDEVEKAVDISNKITIRKGIYFKNVTFEYKYGRKILNNISIKIPINKITTIVGMSGSGKTTLALILIKFYKLLHGNIYLDNISIKNIESSSLRRSIIYLPQKPYIFTGTIAENIELGCEGYVSKEQIEEAAKIAAIHQDIVNLPNGYNTQISEEYGLSGGQQQRIALARAILADSQIIILDEATSNLDTITENKVIDNLIKLKNKTIIFIAHRVNISQKSHNVILMNHGEILEHGTPDELLKKQGMYYKLVKN